MIWTDSEVCFSAVLDFRRAAPTLREMKMKQYLCQLNIATMKTSLDHPSMVDFVNALDYINGLAESHPGFIWRLKDEANGNATTLKPFGEDQIVNMSIWQDAQSLRDFVYKSAHMDYLRRKAEWFSKMDVNQVLWWVPSGHIPSLIEAKEKWDLISRVGPGPEAFGFSYALRAPAQSVLLSKDS